MKLGLILALSALTAILAAAWRISLFYKPFISEQEYLLIDPMAQVTLSAWTILIFAAFYLRKRLLDERRHA